ncbi:uncharacterized protein LOC117173850 [Belonocnema kinseyi]|uniref:uncharacterized protein LOC117173850 n=1 Tax=Belonocnema kinseyi TaxID=2817044 RepID=UPI00143D8566|nr:uncharacterized protein LOC117173850 [Belonocnema kinseyi]
MLKNHVISTNLIGEISYDVRDGSLLYERVPNKPELDRLPLTPPQPQPAMQAQQTILKRTRPFDEINGSDGIALNAGLPGGPPPKRMHHVQPLHPKHIVDHVPPSVMPVAPPLNGRAAHAHGMPHDQPMSRSNARKQVISWMDAPDDVYFRATDQTNVGNHSSERKVSRRKVPYTWMINCKRFRRTLTMGEIKKAARKPWRRLATPVHAAHPQRSARGEDMVVTLD